MHHVQLTGSLALGQNPVGSHFDIATDTDMFLAPVPEPSSIALFGIGLATLGFVGYRRRKQQQAA